MPISETEEENSAGNKFYLKPDPNRPIPPVLPVRESCMFGIIPRQLVL